MALITSAQCATRPSNGPNHLRLCALQHMTLPVMFDGASSFADVHYTIAGWYRTPDSLELLTSVGDSISIVSVQQLFFLCISPHFHRC